MLFTLKHPKSKRHYQLRFKGFSPNKNIIKAFFNALGKYFVRKVRGLVGFIVKTFNFIRKLPENIKDYLVKKLIWSRGRLGRPIANLAVMAIALVVFTFGEVLNSSRFVSGGEISPDYLTYTSDIIPNVNTATTLVPDSRKRAESFEYTVAQGDTLSSIGEKFKISTDALKYVNSLTDSSILSIGQTITIPPVSGLVHTIEDGDTLESIAEKYDVAPQAVADFNYILDTSKLAVGDELVIPGAKVPQPVVPIIPSYPVTTTPGVTLPPASPSQGFCVWPTSTRIITQYFAWYHNGVDISKPASMGYPPVYACREGVVVRAGWDPFGLGLHVRIDHGNGYETVYGHMSSLYVSYGESVSRGQAIGLMGSTGRSTGPHVHFIVKYGGVAQNPLNYTN
jgi:murein DD-endopeptidase MepM/ murein hydrolase activator NlpD